MADEHFPPLSGTTYPGSLSEQWRALETDEQVLAFRSARDRLACDPYRPQYHFSPPGGHMNDPNGLCQWQGRWHLFYQRREEASKRVHWAHAFSDDLLRWRDLPLALYPDNGEKDCYSGQTWVEPDRVVAIYHGTRSGNAVATASDPLLLNWGKHPANPVIPLPPPREDGRPYRVFDPCIWKEEDGFYYSLSGSYYNLIKINSQPVNHLFRSKDLAQWEYLGPLLEGGEFSERGEDAAVPNFWPVGNGRHLLLLFSHKRAAYWYVGHYDRAAHRFHPESHGRMNYGPAGVGSLHAPSATHFGPGKVVAVFNIQEGKVPAGWNGIMSLPRILSLDGENHLRVEPAPEVESLRAEKLAPRDRRTPVRHQGEPGRTGEGPLSIPPNGEIPLEGVFGKAVEIHAVLDPGDAREAGFFVFRSPDGAERTRISFYRHSNALQIDATESSLRGDVYGRVPETGPLHLAEGEPLELRIFLDRSVVEVFANGRQCLTLRAYPQREDSAGASAFARGGGAKLLSLQAWRMESVWPES